MTNKVLRGVVHGKVIELEGDAGMSNGEQVEVIVRRVVPHGRQPGEGFLRTEGALANGPEWDTILLESRSGGLRGRKHEVPARHEHLLGAYAIKWRRTIANEWLANSNQR